jgi:hypothetical protein
MANSDHQELGVHMRGHISVDVGTGKHHAGEAKTDARDAGKLSRRSLTPAQRSGEIGNEV